MSSSRNPNLPTDAASGSPWQAQAKHNKVILNSLLGECYKSLSELQKAMNQMDEAGLHLTQTLSQVLKDSVYEYVGDALATKMSDVYTCAKSKAGMDILNEMGSMLMKLQDMENQERLDPHVYQNTLCHVSLLLIKLKRQYYSVCNNRVADLVHSLLCLKGEEPATGEVTKLVLKLGLADGLESPAKSNSSLPNTPWGSPKNRSKSRQDLSGKSQNRPGFRIMSLFERKTPSEERSSFYVDVDEGSTNNQSSTTDKSVAVTTASSGERKSTPNTSTSNNLESDQSKSSQGSASWVPSTHAEPASKLASEEDLESIINLLSGVAPSDSSPMQAIPEVPHPLLQGGPIQLVVPQIYRLPSPASDTQVEELRSPSRQNQVHRRSEGCLDLSSMWPTHHHHHHIINTNQPPPLPGTNLPWVQIHSASSHGSSISECPSPISGYAGDSSPGYGMSSPSPSFPSSPARLPVSGNTSSHSLSVVGPMANMRGRSLSPFQQWGGVGGSGGSGGGGSGVFSGGTAPGASGMGVVSPRMALTPDFGARRQGTWPMYGATSNQRTMGWSGVQDGSDLSDDSSTEDQFFAVGKDLCHALDSKGGSSDEEGDTSHPGQAKNSSTWPLPHATAGVPDGANRGLTPDLLEPPDSYQGHRPVQMQWSDPISSRSMWPAGSLDSSQRKTSQSMYGFGGAP